MNSKLPAKQRNGIFYKIFLKIKQIFRRKKYEEENLESNKVIVNSNNQFKNNIKIYTISLHNYKLFLQNIKLHFCHFKYKGNKFTVIRLCKPIPFIFTKLFYIIL